MKLALALLISTSVALPVYAAEDYAQRGYSLLNRGSYSQAVTMYAAAIRQNPSDLELRRQLCSAYIGAGMPREAIQQLQALSTISPATARELNMQGEAYNQLGNSRSAIAAYRQALAQDPSNSTATIGLARTLLYTGEQNSAKSVLNAALRTTRDPETRRQIMQMLSTVKDRERVEHQEAKA